MNFKRVAIGCLAILMVVMTPTISRTDVPVSTAILRDDTPIQEVCGRRDRLKLRLSMRTSRGNLQNVVAAGLGRGEYEPGAFRAGVYDFGGYNVGAYDAGFSAGGYSFAPRSRSICGIDAQGYSLCPQSYSLPMRSSYDIGAQSYDVGVRSYSVCPPSSYSFSPPVSYSLASPAVATTSAFSCEQAIVEILKVLLTELVQVQSHQNALLMELLRERGGLGPGTYEAQPPSPRPSSPSNRS